VGSEVAVTAYEVRKTPIVVETAEILDGDVRRNHPGDVNWMNLALVLNEADFFIVVYLNTRRVQLPRMIKTVSSLFRCDLTNNFSKNLVVCSCDCRFWLRPIDHDQPRVGTIDDSPVEWSFAKYGSCREYRTRTP
jgi:hypothetical protein